MAVNERIVERQSAYAVKHAVPELFKRLLRALIIESPPDVAAFLSAEAVRMKDPNYERAPAQRDTSSLISTESFLEQNNVLPLLETLCASLVFAEAAEPLTFIADECARLTGSKAVHTVSCAYARCSCVSTAVLIWLFRATLEFSKNAYAIRISIYMLLLCSYSPLFF